MLALIIPGVVWADVERTACLACLASGDYAGAHARACCEDHSICCDPSQHTNNPWGHKYSPGVCDDRKCQNDCSSQNSGSTGNCDREVNYCECLSSNGSCLNCKGKPGKCKKDECNKLCNSPGEHPLSVKGVCNRSNNYCECHSKEGRCLNC